MSDVPKIGTLTDRIVLQSGTVWARVRRLPKGSHAVVMRFRSDVQPGDTVRHRGLNLRVTSAEDLNGRLAYLACVCEPVEMRKAG